MAENGRRDVRLRRIRLAALGEDGWRRHGLTGSTVDEVRYEMHRDRLNDSLRTQAVEHHFPMLGNADHRSFHE
jgi:hypothetical protein